MRSRLPSRISMAMVFPISRSVKSIVSSNNDCNQIVDDIRLTWRREWRVCCRCSRVRPAEPPAKPVRFPRKSGHQSGPGLRRAGRSNSPYPSNLITLLNTTTGNFPTCAAPNTAVGIAQCSPALGSTVTSPVNFAVGAADDKPIRKVDVWVDRKKQFEQFAGAFSNYAFLNASLPIAAGSHRVSVIAYGWDNSQVSNTSTITVKASPSCSAPTSAGVHICSPTSGSSVSSPVLVTATSKVTGTIASTQLWVDGAKKVSSAASTLTTSVTLAAGSHRFAVIATNTAGTKWESTVTATVK